MNIGEISGSSKHKIRMRVGGALVGVALIVACGIDSQGDTKYTAIALPADFETEDLERLAPDQETMSEILGYPVELEGLEGPGLGLEGAEGILGAWTTIFIHHSEERGGWLSFVLYPSFDEAEAARVRLSADEMALDLDSEQVSEHFNLEGGRGGVVDLREEAGPEDHVLTFGLARLDRVLVQVALISPSDDSIEEAQSLVNAVRERVAQMGSS